MPTLHSSRGNKVVCHTFNHDTSQLPSCRRSRACTADSSTAAHHVHQIPTLHVSNMAIYGQSKKVFLLAVSTLIHVQTALAPTPAPPPSLLPPITLTCVRTYTSTYTSTSTCVCLCMGRGMRVLVCRFRRHRFHRRHCCCMSAICIAKKGFCCCLQGGA